MSGGKNVDGSGAPATTVNYDLFNRVSSILVPGVRRDDTYDALDRVVSSSGNSYTYDYLSTDIATDSVTVVDATETTAGYIREYSSGLLVATKATGVPARRHVLNMHGDVAAITDNSVGTLQDSSVYSPFGASTSVSKPSLGFQADPTDWALGVTDTGARKYLPAMTRFITPDGNSGDLGNPISQNRYGYGNGDPVTTSDLSGNSPLPTIAADGDLPGGFLPLG